MDVAAPEPAASARSTFDLMQYARALWRRKWLALGIAVAVAVLGAVHTLRQPKVYAASASLIIDVAAPRFLDGEVRDVMDEQDNNYWYNREYYETQNKVITSRAVSSRVVDKLGLRSDADFLGLGRVKDPAQRAEAMAAADPVSQLQGMIQVLPVKDSRIVQVLVTDSDPKRAALLANEVSEAYIAENLALRLRVTENASAWLEERLADLEQRAKKSELAVFDFKKDADILTTSLENRLSIVSQRLAAYNESLTAVRTRVAQLEARAEAVRRLSAGAAPDDKSWAAVFDDAAIPASRGLRDQLTQQRLLCAEATERYLEKHPKTLECRAKLALLEDALQRTYADVLRAVQSRLSEAKAEERNLEKLVGHAKAEAFEVNKKQIEYDRLQRESDNNQRLYDLVLKRLKDIELSGLLRTSNVRVLDAARPNFGPIRPNTRGMMTLFALLGVLAGVGAVVGLDFLSSSVQGRADVEERLGLAFLGVVPDLEASGAKRPDLAVHDAPQSTAAECLRAARTNLLFMSPDEPYQTLVVSSSGPREGKSTTLINLGITMAQNGSRVLLMDTDMRRPRLHHAFGLANDVGISTLVVGQSDVERAVRPTEVPGLFVLPCGPLPPNPAELLHTRAFAELLDRLEGRFDRILLDSPPIGAVADALVLAKQADGLVLVLRAGVTHREHARRAVRALRDVSANVVGGLLAGADVRAGGYGVGYHAYDYRPEDVTPGGEPAPAVRGPDGGAGRTAARRGRARACCRSCSWASTTRRTTAGWRRTWRRCAGACAGAWRWTCSSPTAARAPSAPRWRACP